MTELKINGFHRCVSVTMEDMIRDSLNLCRFSIQGVAWQLPKDLGDRICKSAVVAWTFRVESGWV